MKEYRLQISLGHNPEQEAGVDEAGRGCLAGPVFAAAVVLPANAPDALLSKLDDSKKLSPSLRSELRIMIEQCAVAWAVAMASHDEIDQINILNASWLAMHRAIEKLPGRPKILLIDGNRFKAFDGIEHQCIVKGDGRYFSIAAASVLAKTWRDEFMLKQHTIYPCYGWERNMGYPTKQHREAIQIHGLCPIHRRSFNSGIQTKLEL